MKKFFMKSKTVRQYGEETVVETLNVTRLVVTCVIAVFLLITLLSSFSIIPSGYTGVRTTFGQIDEQVLPNGFVFKIPYVQHIQKVNNKQQEITFENKIWGESSERTVVFMENVVVTYRINAEYSAWLYANVTDYVQNALPETLVASAMKASMVSLNSTDVTNRAKIEPICVNNLQSAIDEKYGGMHVISIVNVNINNMDFEDSYNSAIAEKQLAQLEYEKQQIVNENMIQVANAEAEKKKIEAQAEAEKKKIEAQGDADKRTIAAEAEAAAIRQIAEAQADANKKLADSVTPTLIEYQKIEAWDGKLPTVTGANSFIGINIDEPNKE